MKKMGTSFKRSRVHTASLSASDLAEATADSRLHQGLLDTHRQVWVRLLGVSLLLLLRPGVHTILFVPPRVCFPSPV